MPASLYNIAVHRGAHLLELQLPLHLDVMVFDQLNTDLIAYVEKHPGHYLIDLARTDYMGSAVLGLLVNLRSKVRSRGGEMVLCCLSPRLQEIFRIGALERLFRIAPTQDAALQMLGC